MKKNNRNLIENLHLLIVCGLFVYLLTGNSANVTGQIKEASDRPPMFVLQVGISRYSNKAKWAELAGSRTDVDEMNKLLTGERFNIPAANIHALYDEQATKKHIFDEFQNHLIKNAREYFEKTGRRDAVAMFQFSGHGSQVPDVDGDETDGFDETFVTYDSQDLPGKNYDITDDEIYELTKRLGAYTDNIVYIFDSCHSGSGARDAEDVRRVPVRKTVPVPLLAASLRGTEEKTKDNEQTDLLPASDGYIVISAAKSEQLAGQKDYFPDKQAKEPIVFGFLSYYLIDELRNARSNTTYRELMENVRRRVSADKPSQIPQLEGDGGRFVFGALGSREDNFSRIVEAKEKNITIKAGAMQGVTIGTMVAVYDKTATNFAESEKIAAAKVTAVFADRAVAELIQPKRAVTVEDKAVVGAPDLGALRLKVFLAADEGKTSAGERAMLQNLGRKFMPPVASESESRGVDIIGKALKNQKFVNWDVAVLRDDFRKVFPLKSAALSAEDKKNLAADRQVFYLAGKDFVPLFNFFVRADDPQSEQKLEKALVHLARLRMVQIIANNKSALNGKIIVKPVRLISPKCTNGKIAAAKFESPLLNAAKTAYKFQPGEAFWFELTNNSQKELFVAMLGIGTDGSVKVHFPRPIYEENEGVKIVPGEKKIILGDRCRSKDEGVLSITPPGGFETFKIIVSTQQIKAEDFKYLEMEGIGKSRGGQKSLTSLGDWTAVETIFEITVPNK